MQVSILCSYWTNNFEGCHCIRRKGINLLLASRRIHAEAAPVFWSQNVFCFSSPTEVIRDVGARLREEYRELVRHLSVLRVQKPWDSEVHLTVGKETMDNLWEVLLQCTALQSLEISPFHLFVTSFRRRVPFLGHDNAKFLKERRPNFKELRWVNLESYIIARDGERADAPLLSGKPEENIFVLFSRPVDLAKITEQQAACDHVRDFQLNFVVHCRFATESHIFGRSPSLFGAAPVLNRPVRFSFPPDWKDDGGRVR